MELSLLAKLDDSASSVIIPFISNLGVRVVNLDLLSSVSGHSLLVYDRYLVFDPIRCLLFLSSVCTERFLDILCYCCLQILSLYLIGCTTSIFLLHSHIQSYNHFQIVPTENSDCK